MNFNTILYRFGLNPDSFINEENEPIKTENGFIYEVRQRTDIRICPDCGCTDCTINDYDYITINCSETKHIEDVLRIKKVRFKCKNCNKTFTPKIDGIDIYSKTSSFTINLIIKDFSDLITFTDIGNRYNLTTSRVIQLFDEKIPFVPRKTMPFALCIDEIKFNEEINQKYCCVLYDFDNRNIVDIIKNRQLAYLTEYFDEIKEKERDYVKYFISDMYDGYKTIKRRYFRKAIHIIDLFHVITQLTNAVNKLRVIAMNKLDKNSYEYRFMKSQWKQFLCRKENIKDKSYSPRGEDISFRYDDMVFNCILKDKNLLLGYNALQDLYHYNQKYFTFNDALIFIISTAKRLQESGCELLELVGNTYAKWEVEIANGLAKSQTGIHYSNGVAESINNKLKTIMKVSYGYHNFDRFRRRVMVINVYKSELE